MIIVTSEQLQQIRVHAEKVILKSVADCCSER